MSIEPRVCRESVRSDFRVVDINQVVPIGIGLDVPFPEFLTNQLVRFFAADTVGFKILNLNFTNRPEFSVMDGELVGTDADVPKLLGVL